MNSKRIGSGALLDAQYKFRHNGRHPDGIPLNLSESHHNMTLPNRRTFLQQTARAGLAVAAGSAAFSQVRLAAAAESKSGNPLAVFSKSFQDRSIPQICRIFKEIGADGVDLTVRPGGHIDPKNAAEELPPAVQAAQDAGVKIFFLTTAITDPDETSEKLLATAGDLGIDRVKLGYYKYKQFGNLAREMDGVKKRLAAVIKMSKRHGVLPCVHIHSGKSIPSHGTMLYELIKDFSPDEIGAYVDPQHMTKEGGIDGWRQGLDLLGPWIALSSMKNFAWEKTDRDKYGQQQWQTINVPVADGVCPVPKYIDALHKLGYQGVISMHSEYKGGHSFQNLDTDGCIAQTAKDIEFVRQFV